VDSLDERPVAEDPPHSVIHRIVSQPIF
jgi:hypothetical protein